MSRFKFNSRKPRYNDDSDFTTNATSYYEYLARFNKYIGIMTNKINGLLKRNVNVSDTDSIKLNKKGDWLKDSLENEDSLINISADVNISKQKENFKNGITMFNSGINIPVNNGTKIKNDGIWSPDYSNVLKKLSDDIVNAHIENIKKNEQVDYIELLRNYNNFKFMQLLKRSNELYEIAIYDYDKYINFSFATYGDDYWVQSYVTGGDFKPILQGGDFKLWEDINRTGVWSDATNVLNGYTTEIGATFESSLNVLNDDDGISLTLNSNDRGGLWKIEINGEFYKNVSVYSKEPSKFNELLGLFPRGDHTIKGTFMGSDPKNPVSDPRGWLNSSIANTIISGKVYVDIYNPKITFNTPSNKEFALNIAPKDSTNFQFVPFHGLKTAFNVRNKIGYDGNKVIDFESLSINEYLPLNSFSLVQNIYGRNPSSNDENLIELWSNHILTLDGVLRVDGSFKVLKEIDIINSYVIMGVAKGDLFNKIISSFDNSYTGSYGENIPLTESDIGKSYLFLSDNNKNIATAFRYNNIRSTLRQNGTDKDLPKDMAYVQFRNEHITKLYNKLFLRSSLPVGFTHRFSGDYVFSLTPNAYNIFNK